MQAIIQIILAILAALKNNPKKSLAAGAAGAGALTMGLYAGGPTYPPPLVHYVNTANYPGSDGQAIVSDGDGTFTIEAPTATVDATGITDGYVYTADGDATPSWEAAAGGAAVETPDGLTTVSAVSSFNPKDYGASYLDTNAYVTHATTTATATADAGTNVITTSASHGLSDGDGICFTTSAADLPAPLAEETRYWVKVLTSTTFTVHTSRAASVAGTGAIDITDAGTGTHTARLKTTVTFTDGASANTWEQDQWILLLASGPTPTITAPQTTVDGATATYGTKFGTDPTFTAVAATNVVDLNLTTVPIATGEAVWVSSGTTLPAGLSASTDYFPRGPIETQTIVIAGTPTGGTYSVTWAGNTAAGIAYNANEATVETALRTISGLELVEVTTTGSTPNYTHTVQMIGTTGHDIAQMTSSSSLTGGTPTITHATTDHGRDKWILYDTSAHAIAGGATGLIDITDAGTGTHTMVGRTAHYAAFSSGDGLGGWTAATSVGPVYQFNYRASGLTGYGIDWAVHTPQYSRSIAWYGFGSSSRELVRVTGAEGTRYGASDSGLTGFSAVSNNGGNAQIDDYETLAVGDIIEVNATSSGDDGYDGQYRVLSTDSSSNFTLNVAYGSTASGYWQRGQNFYRDWGQNTPLNSYKAIPNVENPPYERRNSVHMPLGTNVWDATNNRLWTVDEHRLSHPFAARSGSSAPSWNTSTANTIVNDGKIRLRLAMPWVPWTEPVAARRQAMTAKVQSKTSTTVVLQDAAFADVGSSSLYAAHDDTMPLRYAINAMTTYGKDATLEFSPGKFPIYTWKTGTSDPDGVAWYTNTGNTSEPIWSPFVLGSMTQQVVVKCQPSTTIRWRAFESQARETDLTATTATGSDRYTTLFVPGNMKFSWDDGRVVWEDFAGGLSEHLTSATFGTAPFVLGNALHTNGTYGQPQDVRISNAEFFVPNWAAITGLDNDTQFWSQTKVLLENNIIAVGGPDGAQTILPHGDFTSKHNWLIAQRLYSSHGYYWNTGKFTYVSDTDSFFGFTGANNYPLQMRGSNSDWPVAKIIVSNMYNEGGERIILGDTSTSNPIRQFFGNNINCDIEMAETFGAQFVNTRGTIYSYEGGRDIQITNHNGNLEFVGSESLKDVTIDRVTGADYVTLTDLNGARIKDIRFRDNAAVVSQSVTDMRYEWVARGVNGEYRLTDRATGLPAQITTPTRLLINGLWTTIPTTGAGSLQAGTACWQDADGLGESYLIVKTNASSDPDTEPTDSIRIGTTTGNSLLLGIADLHDVEIDGVRSIRSDGAGHTLIEPAGGSTTFGIMSDVTVKNVWYEEFVDTTAASKYAFDFKANAANRLDNFVVDGLVFRPVVPGSATNFSPFYGTFDDNSSWTFRNWETVLDSGVGNSGIAITSQGKGVLENVALQDNERFMTLSESADTLSLVTSAQISGTCSSAGSTTTIVLPSGALTYNDAYNNLPVVAVHANGLIEKNYITDYVGGTLTATVRNNWNVTPSTSTKVQVGGYHQTRSTGISSTVCSLRFRSNFALPNYTIDGGGSTALSEVETYYRASSGTLYNTEANAVAAGATGNLEFAGSGNYFVTAIIDYADAAEGAASLAPFDPDVTHPANWVKGGRNVNLRGGNSQWKYAEVTAAQTDNLDLYPVDIHLFTTDDTANLITGFNGGWAGRVIRVMNVDSADNLNFDHNNGAAGSRNANKFISPTGADFVLGPNETITMVYIDSMGWVIQNYVAQNEVQPEAIKEMFHSPLWAIEPKRVQLALAA